MLTVSKLNEAIDYLTIQTGRTWSESELLDCVMSTRIDIHAAAPATAQVSINKLGISDLVEKYRMPHGHTLLAALHPANVAELLVRGETLTSHPFNPSQINSNLSVKSLDEGEIISDVNEYHLFTEPVLVRNKDIRIRRETLKLILDLWNDAQKDYPTLRVYPEWMKPVESLPVAQTETTAEVKAAPITQADTAATVENIFIAEPRLNELISLNVDKAQYNARPQQQQRFQEDEILRIIKELGFSANAIPKRKAGRSGVKADVRKKLSFSVSVFDKAWERLRANNDIQDEK